MIRSIYKKSQSNLLLILFLICGSEVCWKEAVSIYSGLGLVQFSNSDFFSQNISLKSWEEENHSERNLFCLSNIAVHYQQRFKIDRILSDQHVGVKLTLKLEDMFPNIEIVKDKISFRPEINIEGGNLSTRIMKFL
jgi:hypothetical protein